MSKKTRRIAGEPTGFERVLERAEQSPVGFHDLRSPAEHTTTGLPPGAAEMYLWFDGGGLFFDTVTIVAAQDCVRSEETGRWQLGELDGHAIELDQAGRVWRLEGSLDAWLVDGTTLDRWLAGCLQGYPPMYDGDGEFADQGFPEDGDLTGRAPAPGAPPPPPARPGGGAGGLLRGAGRPGGRACQGRGHGAGRRRSGRRGRRHAPHQHAGRRAGIAGRGGPRQRRRRARAAPGRVAEGSRGPRSHAAPQGRDDDHVELGSTTRSSP